MSKCSENPFWQYSLAHYARREVADTCLDLQDRCAANVNLLLFCCWLGSRGELIEDAQLRVAQALIEEWDREVVRSLRQVRRFLKQSELAIDSMVQDVAALELAAERVVQDVLMYWWLESAGQTDGAGDGTLYQRENLTRYLHTLDEEVSLEGSPLLWPLNAPRARD